VLRHDIDAEVRTYVEKILSEAIKASGIITNLGSYAGTHTPRREPVDVAETVRRALEVRSHALKVDNVKVTRRFECETIFVLGDERQLSQAFVHIVSNAQQAMVDANKGGTLEVSLTRVGGAVRICFADDGPGIDDDQLGRVFDPFFTTKEVGEGTGLGLSVCYGTIKDHGGFIGVESTAGGGATFVVELPAAEAMVGESSMGPVNIDASSKGG
jgi:two-component system NtrC family sensor kinase